MGIERTPDQRIAAGIFVSLSPAMKADVVELAQRDGRTVSGVVRFLLMQRLARRRRG